MALLWLINDGYYLLTNWDDPPSTVYLSPEESLGCRVWGVKLLPLLRPFFTGCHERRVCLVFPWLRGQES